MTRKRLVTIVSHIENLELRKDTGQIPYQIHKLLGYESTLVTYFYTLHGGRSAGPINLPPNNKQDILEQYPYLESEVSGLKINFLKNKGRGKFYERAILEYLRNNARKIDVLNLFHFNTENIFYALFYKILNPSGKVYLKLDIDLNYYRSRQYFYNTNSIFFALKKIIVERLLYNVFFSLVNLISAESNVGLEYFKNRFKVDRDKMLLIPNGVDKSRIDALVKQKSFKEKQNLIITVGRIGTTQKNNELLLEAITSIDLKDWKVLFIGEIEPSFKNDITKFFMLNPTYENKVVFKGKITDPAKLYEYYNDAKVFCLTSIDEGFPLSACEAAFFGNYLILPDSVYGFNELTNTGIYGVSLKNSVTEFSKAIQNIMSKDPKYMEEKYNGMKQHAESNLCWQSIIPHLKNKLE